MQAISKILLASVPALALVAGPAEAVQFDFETTSPGYYAGGLSVVNGGLTLTVTPEAPNDWISIENPNTVPLLGSQSAIGTAVNPTVVNGFVPMRFTFSSPIVAITFAFGDAGGDDDSPWTISAYDSADNLLGSTTGSYPAGYYQGLTSSLTLGGPGASYFIVTSTPDFNPDSMYWEVVDAQTVPEPSTLLMLGSALLGLVYRRRRGA